MMDAVTSPAAGRETFPASRRLPFLAVGLGVFLADQLSKGWAQRLPEQVAGATVVPHLLQIFPVRNPGIAFSLFAGFGATWRMGLASISALVLLLVTWMVFRRPVSRPALAGLAMILGGAGGNLMDRVLFGNVTDFLLVSVGGRYGPIFNLADAAITAGAILLIWDILRTGSATVSSEGEVMAIVPPPRLELGGSSPAESRWRSSPSAVPPPDIE